MNECHVVRAFAWQVPTDLALFPLRSKRPQWLGSDVFLPRFLHTLMDRMEVLYDIEQRVAGVHPSFPLMMEWYNIWHVEGFHLFCWP